MIILFQTNCHIFQHVQVSCITLQDGSFSQGFRNTCHFSAYHYCCLRKAQTALEEARNSGNSSKVAEASLALAAARLLEVLVFDAWMWMWIVL